MVLSDNEIRTLIANGDIIIDPPPSRIATTTALDLTLGNEFRVWKQLDGKGVKFTIDPSSDDFDFEEIAAKHTEPATLQVDGCYLLEPRSFVLGITAEHVELPTRSRIAARVEGRSSMARLGVGVHLTAPTIHAGFRGKITLEITNHGPLAIVLRPGLRICQLVFEQVFGTPGAEMKGPFQDQQSVTGAGKKESVPAKS